ncbi:MAG TPA: phosphonoacetaldehyde hydrolase [Candidatus Hydrogenedentes bacterium]|nr:phosphonoacetaldehyde hydrolase [Candidatus Hydrogenedentota bacterium]
MEFTYQRSYRGPLKAVILDWAGTTMDYGCFAPAVVFIEVYKRHGVEISMAQARGPMGAHKRDHIRQIAQMEEVAEKWQAIHGRRPTEEDVEAMFTDFVPMQVKCLADYADLVPGCLEALDEFRKRGLKIGSTTGYTDEMVEVLLVEASKRGYVPDSTVCATQVPAGRPTPWMCLQNAMNLGVFPMEAIVKVGDTLPDIYEGLNAGMWTVGLAMTGNEMGMTLEEIEALDPEVRARKRERAYTRMAQAGAHYVVDAIGDVPPLLDDINARLACGERP